MEGPSPGLRGKPSEFLNPTIQLEDQYVTACIDTGADVSILSLDLARALEKKGVNQG
ncbi:ltr-retrotransposon skipper, partial [Lasius niger]